MPQFAKSFRYGNTLKKLKILSTYNSKEVTQNSSLWVDVCTRLIEVRIPVRHRL